MNDIKTVRSTIFCVLNSYFNFNSYFNANSKSKAQSRFQPTFTLKRNPKRNPKPHASGLRRRLVKPRGIFKLPLFVMGVVAMQVSLSASQALAQIQATHPSDGANVAVTADSPVAEPMGVNANTDANVNINSASADELARQLNGVGSSKAEAIVRYREQFGPFESIDELAEVVGIGPSTVERNRPLIRLD